MSIYVRIRQLCKENGETITGLESELGFARGSLSKIDNHKPSAERIHKIADHFNVTVEFLTGESKYKTKEEMLAHLDGNTNLDVLRCDVFRIEKGFKIPVLGSVTAGIPIDAIENIEGYEEIDINLAKTGNFFALRISGDSMQPQICKNDIVIVKQQPIVENGDIAIVLVNGNDATCKKIKKLDDSLMLISNNPKYEPMIYSANEVQELPVQILGKVIESRRKF